MITSEDSKVRILEGVELVQTYKGREPSVDKSVRITSTYKFHFSMFFSFVWSLNNCEHDMPV